MATATSFTKTAFEEFLSSGWLVSEGTDRLIVGWGEWKEDANPNPDRASLFAPDFYLRNRHPWVLTPHWSIVTREIFASHVLAKLPREVNGDLQGFQWVEPSFDGFSRQFEAIHEGRNSRGLVKAVPIVHAQTRDIVNQARLLSVLNKLSNLPPSLSAYGFWQGGAGSDAIRFGLIGATPELLFSEENGIVTTMALAGTRAKKSSEDSSLLLADPKERKEHQLVIDDIADRLSRVGKVEIGETRAFELPTLFHLKTEIKVAVSRQYSLSELSKLLHPTPALGVSPRALGFEEIERWDDVALRGRYGAPFGVSLPDGTSRCFVAIRGIQWQDDSILLGSGCGIVSESVLDREWRELSLKRESVRRLLGI
jgi:menaquinone-specific isochorismate synthase